MLLRLNCITDGLTTQCTLSRKVLLLRSIVLPPLTLEPQQLLTLLNIQDWQSRSEEARLQDQKSLNSRLETLEHNQSQLKDVLSMSTRIVQFFIALQLHYQLEMSRP